MFFVKNFINKLSRKDRKDTVDFTKTWWDSKHVKKGKDLCSYNGHKWKFIGDEHLAICEVCKEFAVK